MRAAAAIHPQLHRALLRNGLRARPVLIHDTDGRVRRGSVRGVSGQRSEPRTVPTVWRVGVKGTDTGTGMSNCYELSGCVRYIWLKHTDEVELAGAGTGITGRVVNFPERSTAEKAPGRFLCLPGRDERRWQERVPTAMAPGHRNQSRCAMRRPNAV